MNHEELNDFTPEENKAFADVICEGMKQEDIENLEAAADAAVLEISTMRAFDAITQVIDQMLEHFDYEATVAALEQHIEQIHRAFGDNDEEA